MVIRICGDPTRLLEDTYVGETGGALDVARVVDAAIAASAKCRFKHDYQLVLEKDPAFWEDVDDVVWIEPDAPHLDKVASRIADGIYGELWRQDRRKEAKDCKALANAMKKKKMDWEAVQFHPIYSKLIEEKYLVWWNKKSVIDALLEYSREYYDL